LIVRRQTWGFPALTVLALPLVASPALAQTFVPVFQDRMTNVIVSLSSCGTDNTMDRAEDFGPFDSDLVAEQTCDDGKAIANSQQHSVLTDRMVMAEISTAGNFDLGSGSGLALFSQNFMTYTFRIEQATDYTIDGVVRAAPMEMFASISAGVLLRGPNGTTVLDVRAIPAAGEAPLEVPFSQTGTLLPGEYFLYVSSNVGLCAGNTGGEDGSASARARLALTGCFGDLDGDGSVGLGDLSLTLANYGMTAGATLDDGDFDADGDVDLTDLSEMFARYGSSCD